jgi:hypothetical protein
VSLDIGCGASTWAAGYLVVVVVVGYAEVWLCAEVLTRDVQIIGSG